MASNDRLSVLPKELLDEIYSLVFPSENGPWTVHVQAKPQPLDRDERELGSLSVLAMPRDDRYHSRRQRHPSEFWPDDVERAFMRALDWVSRIKIRRLIEVMAEIIYELTGVRHCRKRVSSHLQVLRTWVRDMETASKHILEDIVSDVEELKDPQTLEDPGTFMGIIERMEDRLQDLARELLDEHETVEEGPPKPPILDFRSSPAITPNAENFRLLSTIASDPDSKISLLSSVHNEARHAYLSLTLVNRFHRTHALAFLASNLVYDFGDDTELIYRLPATGDSIKRLRLTFVEGFMADRLAPGALAIFPNLRELFVELWPRDPTRTLKGDRSVRRDDRSWGEQTLRLLDALQGLNARVVLQLRWESDCERFEREYVGVRGWRLREEREGVNNNVKEGMCWRSYELTRKSRERETQ